MNLTRANHLSVSEKFYSIQCEGVSTGVPSYFIRLKGCNLSCGISPQQLKQLSTNLHTYNASNFEGDLLKEGKSTWYCDTALSWLQGKLTPYNDIIEDWRKENIFDLIASNRCHIIWTGGEPTLKIHQEDILRFNDFVNDTYSITPYNEIETNGTLLMRSDFFDILDQINCSPKLANSGMSYERRVNKEALLQINSHSYSWFKFVISSEKDVEDICNEYVKNIGINESKIILMPGLEKQDNFFERTKLCLELAKKYGFIASTRLHVAAWNQLTGV